MPRRGPRVDDGSERRSARNVDKKAPDYSEPPLEEAPRGSVPGGSGGRRAAAAAETSDDPPATKRQKILHANRKAELAPAKPVNARSCKVLNVDLEGLAIKLLGEVIPPMGGQVKRAAMEAASAEGPPSFSRMSGIQEWQNAVCLFINVYGDGYKNVFLDQGKEVLPLCLSLSLSLCLSLSLSLSLPLSLSLSLSLSEVTWSTVQIST